MDLVGPEPCPLPDHPALADVATALADSGSWGIVVDADWRVVYMTDDIRLSNGRLLDLVPVPRGAHYFSDAALTVMLGWSGEVLGLEAYRYALRALGPWVLADAPGGAAAARKEVSPRLADVLDDLEPSRRPTAIAYGTPGARSAGAPAALMFTAVRLTDASGAHIGTAIIGKPRISMTVLGTLSTADPRHFDRMQQLVKASRHPAAILFADLEGSSSLSRRLSTANYFRLGRRLVRTADSCVVEAGGLVGRHAGDGVVAFFLAEHTGSESAAARACILATRALRDATDEVAARSGLEPADVVMRFGLHWGSTLYIGQISTAARVEVNALGDEVNEAARIEACATGGRILASKPLMERLDLQHAAALGIDPDRLNYTALADLITATEKARRDAPAIAVCQI